MATVGAQDIQHGIDVTNREFERLFNAGDPAAAARAAYSADAQVLPPGAQPVHGREAIAQFWAAAAAQMGIQSLHLTTMELHQLGEGAYEIGSALLNLAGGAQAEVKYLVVWMQEDGAWKLHVDIWNPNA